MSNYSPKDGSSMFLRKVCIHVQVHVAWQTSIGVTKQMLGPTERTACGGGEVLVIRQSSAKGHIVWNLSWIASRRNASRNIRTWDCLGCFLMSPLYCVYLSDCLHQCAETGQDLLPFDYGTRLFEWFRHAQHQPRPCTKSRLFLND
jgi:hypothetical protein